MIFLCFSRLAFAAECTTNANRTATAAVWHSVSSLIKSKSMDIVNATLSTTGNRQNVSPYPLQFIAAVVAH